MFQIQISSAVEFLPDTLGAKLSIEERSVDGQIKKTREIKYYIKETRDRCDDRAFIPPNMISSTNKTIVFLFL